MADSFTTTEHTIDLAGCNVTAEELDRMKEIFARVPYPAFRMPKADLQELLRLLPKVKQSDVEDCLVKPLNGPCGCGRKINLLDITVAALKSGKHGPEFLSQILQGTNGKFVIVGYQSHRGVPSDLEGKLPAKTIYVRDVAPIPCRDCGRAQDAMLIQGNVCHFWVQ